MKKRRPTRFSPQHSEEVQTTIRPIHNSQFIIHNSIRVGLGNDIHRLESGRKLILGGVRIPFKKGPVGHSDGDALAHAVCDALLGAAALGDIGTHFPNSSPKWRNVSSLLFLRHTRKLLHQAGYAIVNIDATVGLEQPKLAPYIPRTRKKLATALGIRVEQISVKAKTGEGVDAVGRGEAIRADAIALLAKVQMPRPLIRGTRDEPKAFGGRTRPLEGLGV
jgi:2-C-methyl-D-erythritol 2,4-cyclodiphosphate synthase